MRELEIVAADVLEGASERRAAPPPGSVCANCGTPLAGPYCHACGQNADLHKRSIGRLIVEGFEGVLHLDGRVMRTVPDLFIHPGRLARDFLEGRVARHVPPFRMFLVSLLVWVFAAEYAAHHTKTVFTTPAQAKAAFQQSPAERAKSAAEMQADAVKDRDSDLKEAADDRDGELKDPEENKAKVQLRYQEQVAHAQTRYQAAVDDAARVTQGLPPTFDSSAAQGQDAPTRAWWASKAAKEGNPTILWSKAWWIDRMGKARDNPEYYLSVMFTWGHRVAFLLLPIVGLALTAAYFYKRRFFIYDHMVTAMNFLSFLFLANAPGFLLPSDASGVWFTAVGIWTPINLYQTLRGGYGSSRIGAALKALGVWSISFIAFFMLVSGLFIFTLTQL